MKVCFYKDRNAIIFLLFIGPESKVDVANVLYNLITLENRFFPLKLRDHN